MKKIYLPMYDPGKCRLFALGRNAMYAACSAMGLKSGDEVLTPAFDCDGSLQPFNVLGIRPVFYRSDPYNFQADLSDIRKKMGARVKLIHVINHFGMPQAWDEIINLRKTLDIPIMEDNAYSLFSRYGGRSFGTFGDVSVFSLRKNLPLAEGGMLRINNERYIFNATEKRAPFIYGTEISGIIRIGLKKAVGAGVLVKWISRKVNRRDLPPPPLPSEAGRSYQEWDGRDTIGREFSCDYIRPISKMSEIMLAGFTAGYYNGINEAKRNGYKRLAGLLKDIKGLRVLWPDIPEGIVPFSLSLLVDAGRDRLLERLQAGFDVMAWPTLPSEVIERLADFPEVELLGRRLLQINLPCDKVMSPGFKTYLEAIAREIRLNT